MKKKAMLLQLIRFTLALGIPVLSQTTEFTYQGRLTDSSFGFVSDDFRVIVIGF